MKLVSTTPDGWDEWEIDYFYYDHKKRALAKPVLGVRVNDGAWMDAELLEQSIAEQRNAACSGTSPQILALGPNFD